MVSQPAPSGPVNVGGVTLNVSPPSGGSGGGSSIYTTDSSITGVDVKPGNLPFIVTDTSGKPIDPSAATGEDILYSLAHATPQQIATVQTAMSLAGLYSSSANVQRGVFGYDDVGAFTKAIRLAAQTGQPVSSALAYRAQVGAQQGISSAVQATVPGQSGSTTRQQPNRLDVAAIAQSAFQAELGRDASPKELSKFVRVFRRVYGQVGGAGDKPLVNPNALPSPFSQSTPVMGNTAPEVASAGYAHGDVISPHMVSSVAPSFAQQISTAEGALNQSTSILANATQQAQQAQQGESPASPSNFADNYVRQHYGTEAGAQSANRYYNLIFQALGSSA